MYPFRSEQPYLTEQWYPAAWSHEIGRHLFERTLLDQPVLMFRAEDGRVQALHGICPHRNLPLSCGRLVGDEVACGYHGFRFDGAGRCTHIPTQAEAPANYRLRHYPVIERAGLVWLWVGAPDAAAPFPDLDRAGIGSAGWAAAGHIHMQLQARWALLLDNLFDLSHIGWVHARSIGANVASDDEGVAGFALLPIEVEDKAESFTVRRVARGVPLDPFNRFLYPHAPHTLDLDIYTDLVSPAIVNAGNATFSATSGERLGNLNFIHLWAPETARTTHYFGMVVRDFRVDDAALCAALGAKDNEVRAEDKQVLEQIEPVVDRYGDVQRELSAKVDAGAIRLRRRLDAALSRQSATAGAQQTTGALLTRLDPAFVRTSE